MMDKNYEERKMDILKALAHFDNLGRVLNKIEPVSYAQLREKIAYDDFFWLVRELHQQFLIDAIIPNEELEKNPDDPEDGTLQIRKEGIAHLMTHR